MKYKIATDLRIKEVEGEVFDIYEYQVGIREELEKSKDGNFTQYTITELSTGMFVCSDLDKAAAIREAKRLFKENDETKFIAKAKRRLKAHGYIFPVNQTIAY